MGGIKIPFLTAFNVILLTINLHNKSGSSQVFLPSESERSAKVTRFMDLCRCRVYTGARHQTQPERFS